MDVGLARLLEGDPDRVADGAVGDLTGADEAGPPALR
jgi:hypothetical protein